LEFGISADFPWYTPHETKDWYGDRKQFPAVEQSSRFFTDYFPLDKGNDPPHHQFHLYVARYGPNSKDRDRELTKKEIFEAVRRWFSIDAVSPKPVTWGGKPADEIECDAFYPGKKVKYRATIRRLETGTEYVLAFVMDGGDLPPKARDWFFNSFAFESK
jgi:hypothetical protein